MPFIERNVSLKSLNTFGIDASAKYFVIIRQEEELQEVIQSSVYQNEKHLILGGGSNMLFTQNFDGLVIKNELKGYSIEHETDENLELSVKSGEVWHDLVMHCVQKNWGGLENLSLIPGTVGAAPIQNIGAYGVEVKDVIKNVEGIDLITGKKMKMNRDECHFGYRESVFKQEWKENFFISSVTLTLTKKNHLHNTSYGALQEVIRDQHDGVVNIKTISDSVIFIRQSKLPDPRIIGNAGSFFKNPSISKIQFENLKKDFPLIPGYASVNQEVKVAAGWLIEQCGWKGKKENEIGVHPQQALVLVNYGNGKGQEIFSLAMKIQSSVKEKFGITLTPEVNII